MWFFKREGESGFSGSSTAEEVTQGIDGTNLTAIVTGASSGIGLETTRVLALRGVRVIMAVRNVNAGRNAKEAMLKDMPAAKIDVMELDLSSFESVRKFASAYIDLEIPLNILINNAGVYVTEFLLSKDNIELQFATNHLGHFLLTNLLLDVMKATATAANIEGRIVNVSSVAHKFGYREGIQFDKINQGTKYNYGQSKLANVLHSKELARRFKEQGIPITANSLHPGLVVTNILREDTFFNGLLSMIGKFFFKSIHLGAATTCYVALNPRVKGVTGEYFSDCNLSKVSPLADDQDLAKKLWEFSLNLIDPK